MSMCRDTERGYIRRLGEVAMVIYTLEMLTMWYTNLVLCGVN